MRLFPFLLAAATVLSAANEHAGRRAPGFSLPDHVMKQFDLYDFRGKPVVLELMQTRCPHCLELGAVLEKINSKYGAQIQILSIVLPPDQLKDVEEYISSRKVTTPVLFDCGQVTASYLKITPKNPKVSFPHLFLIDKDGVIRHDLDGGADADRALMTLPLLSSQLDKLLGGSPAKPASSGKK